MHISRLFIHPVKSLGGVAVDACRIDRFGPRWDRRWMVVDEQGQFLTQRQIPRMALISASLQQGQVCLRSPEGELLTFSATDFDEGETLSVRIWQDQCAAKLGQPFMHEWISHALGKSCRLVFMHDASERAVDEHFAGKGHTVSFADGFPLLLAQQSSLNDFNQHLSVPIGMERFRPNLVVEGGAAWQEDKWRLLRIGEMLFDVVKPCSRCAIPTINPADASKQPEVFKALRQHRSRDGDVFFGQNLVARGEGVINQGDRVEVLE